MATTLPQVYDSGPQIRRKMLELIESATDYILIDSFLVVPEETTMEVLEALEKKHSAGVRVYVIADSSSKFVTPDVSGFDYFHAAGIPCVEYNPMEYYKLVVAPVMLPRDHRKFWIVDGRVLFLGGANIIATSLDPLEEGGNQDFMLAVESEAAIQQMIDSFVTAWNRSSRENLSAKNFAVRAQGDPETHLWLFDQNRTLRLRNVIPGMVDDLFAMAREEVWLVQPYTFVTPRILRQIRTLTDRGVEVNVMLSSEVHSPKFHFASFYGIKDILGAGGKVWVYEREKACLHSKLFIIDGRCVSVGSANLNTRSYHLSKEANLVFEDPESVSEIMRSVGELKQNCRPVGIEESESYRSLKYFRKWCMMQWAG